MSDDVLQAVVERALEVGSVTLGAWSAEEIVAGDGQGLGVFRLAGDASVGGDVRHWSVILKVLPEEASERLSAWSVPQREPLAYVSGLLDALPLGAPRCLGYERHHLWLEDLGSDDTPWTLSDYADAARELGRFNGAYLHERPLPAFEWLSRDWLRSWLAENEAALDKLPRHLAHPLVRRMYSRDSWAQMMHLWAQRDRLLAALDRLPQVLCHNDAFRRNLFLRSGRLIAIDWAFLGVGPLGSDLAPLICASAVFLGVDRGDWDDLERTAVAAYGQGLIDAGWDGPPELPRLGFAASSALRYWPGVVRLVLPTLLDEAAQRRTEAMLGLPFDQIVDLWVDFTAWQTRLAAEALSAVA